MIDKCIKSHVKIYRNQFVNLIRETWRNLHVFIAMNLQVYANLNFRNKDFKIVTLKT